jgi:hypothetical protein
MHCSECEGICLVMRHSRDELCGPVALCCSLAVKGNSSFGHVSSRVHTLRFRLSCSRVWSRGAALRYSDLELGRRIMFCCFAGSELWSVACYNPCNRSFKVTSISGSQQKLTGLSVTCILWLQSAGLIRTVRMIFHSTEWGGGGKEILYFNLPR